MGQELGRIYRIQKTVGGRNDSRGERLRQRDALLLNSFQRTASVHRYHAVELFEKRMKFLS